MLKSLMVFLVILLPLVSQAADLNYPNRYGTMASSMFDMMDAFSSAYQKRMGNNDSNHSPAGSQWSPGNIPWSQGGIPWSMGSMPWTSGGSPWSQPNMPWQQGIMPGAQEYGLQMLPSPGSGTFSPYTQNPPSSGELDGSWQGRSGEVLVIHNGHFRIYLNRDEYREGRLLLSGNDRLSMQDPKSGTTRQYQYAEHQGKLALQDERGNLLLYRRIE